MPDASRILARASHAGVPSQVAVVLAALATWQVVSVTEVNSNTLPSVTEVAAASFALLSDASTWVAVRDTYVALAASIGLAFVIAVPLGVLIGRVRFAYRSTRFLVDFLRTVPGLALLPLASLLFGTSLSTQLMIVVPTCIWPLLLQTCYGARDIDPLLMDVSKMYRFSRRATSCWVVLASCAEYLATGLRLAIIMGFIATVGTELVAGTPGIGLSLANAQAVGATLDVYAYTLIIALMGFITTILVVMAERAVIPWRVSARGAS